MHTVPPPVTSDASGAPIPNRRPARFLSRILRTGYVSQATRDEQLANIRQIYPPEREALGVVAIGIELVDPPRLS